MSAVRTDGDCESDERPSQQETRRALPETTRKKRIAKYSDCIRRPPPLLTAKRSAVCAWSRGGGCFAVRRLARHLTLSAARFHCASHIPRRSFIVCRRRFLLFAPSLAEAAMALWCFASCRVYAPPFLDTLRVFATRARISPFYEGEHWASLFATFFPLCDAQKVSSGRARHAVAVLDTRIADRFFIAGKKKAHRRGADYKLIAFTLAILGQPHVTQGTLP